MKTQLYYNLKKTLFVFLLALSGTAYVFGQAPVANFSANTLSGCAPLSVRFTDQSTGNPTEWNWEFSNGTLSNAQNPTVSFSAPGTYSAKLVVRNADGIAEFERIDYITVYRSPIADFDADLTLGCVPVTVKFIDRSSAPGSTVVRWEWEFGDGNTSTEQSPSHTYANTGFYTVFLRVYNSEGCSRRIGRTRYIRVVDGVNTNFNFSLAGTCKAPFTVNFQNQSSGPGTIAYDWDFGNGQTSTVRNPSVIYNAPGTYNVKLVAQSNLGCGGDITKQIVITETNTDFTSPSTACIDRPVTFQNNSSAVPKTSFWDFGDGTTSAQISPVKTFLTPGVYTVNLINNYENCTDSIKKTITVIDKPAVEFQANATTSCQAPFTVQFSDLTPGATSWLWDFGDGNTSTQQNPSHVYNSLGNYTVKLTANTSTDCADSITKVDYIKIQETSVEFDNGKGCIPFTYSPVLTIQTIDPIASYLWDFGDGATSPLQNPSHTYTIEGTFTVKLTVTTVSGCTKTADGQVRTGTPPTVSFTANPLTACASQQVSFAGQATTTPGAEVIWSWDFGDGASSSVQSPRHTFLDTGALIVRLTVLNNGCGNFATQTVQIQPPKAKFDYTVNCANRAVTIINESLVNPTLTPTSYKWEMGDPSNTVFTTATPPPGFLYPSPGTYNVTLTITNGLCSDILAKPVIIVDEVADFSINKNPVCKDETFTLSAINSDADHIANYTWTIGATIVGSGRTLNHKLPATGLYNVGLTITDINGCSDTKTVTDYIDVKGSVARFVPTTPGGCVNKTVTFDAQSSTSTTNLVKWDWNFGDGTQQSFTAPPFTHIYSQTGRYNVSLTVTDATGCTDKYTLPLRITNLIAGFRADTFYCPQAPLQFADTSSGTGLTYLWNFGDGNTSTLQNPTNSYPLADSTYSVKLKIRDISGCEDSITKTDYINIRSPKAAFDIRDTATFCPPLRTTFTFKGSDYKSFYWDFGDGNRSSLQNPIYFYGDYGHFTPKLYLVGAGGCIDSAESSVSVYDPIASTQINYVVPAGTICDSLTVNFNLVIPSAFKFYFDFDDGTIDSSQQKTLSHFYSSPNTGLQPRIILFDTVSGCQEAKLGTPIFNIYGAVPFIGKDKKEFCDQGVVVFRGVINTNDRPIRSILWNFGDNTTSTEQHPSHNFTQPGTYIVKLEVTTNRGCQSSVTDTVRVYRTPAPSIQGRDTICINVADPYEGVLAIADTLTTWQWNFGNGQSSSQQNNSITYSTAGPYPIKLTATNKIGCSSEATKNIYVSPLPTAIPAQDPLTIAVGSGANIIMDYTGSIASYNWIPTTRLSCTDCPSPYANPQFTTKYTVQLIDSNGCKNSGDITVLVVCGKQNFFVPNTFSPNGDGRNEVFYPKGTGLFRIKSMRVFNRWGEIVFEKNDFAANDPSAGWNGTYKGKTASPDAYIYTMEILCENNTVIPVKGNVTLLR